MSVILILISAGMLCACVTSPRRGQGRYPNEPHPEMTLAHSVFIPGGGWFYLADRPGGKSTDWAVGLAYLAGTVASFLVTANSISQGGTGAPAVTLALGLGIRYFDLTESTQEAIRRQAIERKDAPAHPGSAGP